MTAAGHRTPRWNPRTFYARQALHLTIALVVLLGAYKWLSSTAWMRGEVADTAADALTVAELLASIGAEDTTDMHAALVVAMRSRSVDSVWLTEDGRVAAFAERRDSHVRISTGPAAAALPPPVAQRYQPGSGDPVRMVVMSRRLEAGEGLGRGSVYIKPAAEETSATFNEWIGAIVAFLAALGAGLLLVERILRPVSAELGQLTEFARRIGNEESPPAPPQPRSASEFAELAAALSSTWARVVEQRRIARAAHERLNDAIDALEDGFALFDADDRLTLCNETYRRFYGSAAKVVVPGARFEDLVREGVRRGLYELGGMDPEDWIAQRLARHRRAAPAFLQELAGSTWWRIAEHRTTDGGIVGFRTEVTALVEAQARAEAASRAKTDFLTNVSHELRTPLNGVIGALELLRATSIDAEQETYVRTANSSAGDLLAIISDVLDVSRIESGKLDVQFAALRPADEARAVACEFAPAAHAKGVSLEVLDRLDPGPRLGDAARLRQVLRNLVGNAVKFTERGSVELRVSEESGGVRFEVADTGIGIPESFRGQLYQPFTQADASLTRRNQGSGLGLAITRELVGRMGGRITFDSTPGRGTTFSVFLPLGPVAPAAEPPAPAAEPPTPAAEAPAPTPDARASALEGLDILVAEDNGTSRLIVVRILEGGGARVRGAASGAAALALFDEQRPNLVVTDLQMGAMSGFDLTREIRARDRRDGRRTPVLALTANALSGTRELCLAADMDSFVSKPFTTARLYSELLGMLGRAAAPPAPTGHPFARALDFLDGDAGLLVAAGSVAWREILGRDHTMRAALERRDCAALAHEAHRARYAWALFAPEGEAGILDEIEGHARASEFDAAERATRAFLARQSVVGEALGAWLSAQAPDPAPAQPRKTQ